MSQNYSLPIPHLKKGQSVKEWRILYTSATALLKQPEQIQFLPIAVDRSPADQSWAFKATKQDTLKKALDELELRLDGKPTRFMAMKNFYDLRPAVKISLTSLSGFFFDVLEAGKAANVTFDLIALKFLQHVPGSTKLFSDNEQKIKADMTEDALIEFFDIVKSKLSRKAKGDPSFIKEEVFAVEDCIQAQEETIPRWAEQLRSEVMEIKQSLKPQPRVVPRSSDSCSSSTDDAFYNNASKPKSEAAGSNNSCSICGLENHRAKTCFKRICKSCDGRGHDAENCSSNFRKRGKGHKGKKSSKKA
jgi:hypothetical protein